MRGNVTTLGVGRRLSPAGGTARRLAHEPDAWFGAAAQVSAAAWERALSRADALLERVPSAYRRRCENVLRGRGSPGFSQAWQDWILYRNFFAVHPRRGLYVDVGANDAVSISNTVFFDKCLGWEGVCFEPQSVYHARLRSERSCRLVPQCVLGKAGAASVEDGAGSMFRLTNAPKARPSAARSMPCVGFEEQLRALGLGGRTIDLLSIDIEGLEGDVLRCMPWAKLDVRLVLIETNKHELRTVDAFFSHHGYANVASLHATSAVSRNKVDTVDHLYAKLPGGPLVLPTAAVVGAGDPNCTARERAQNPWACKRRLPEFTEFGPAKWVCPDGEGV